MRYIAICLAFTLIALLAWPYIYVYRLDRAVASNDIVTLKKLVDVDAIRDDMKQKVDRNLSSRVGRSPGSIIGWIQEGVRQVGVKAIDMAVDLEWVLNTLRTRHHNEGEVDPSFLSDTSFAFFESYDRFLIRIGELGEDPIHVRLRLAGGAWRVTGIYD
ncbi:MAG: DUF2939 domain-containing protein [Pseudomonadota bacterium]